jgi:hypothetical protein
VSGEESALDKVQRAISDFETFRAADGILSIRQRAKRTLPATAQEVLDALGYDDLVKERDGAVALADYWREVAHAEHGDLVEEVDRLAASAEAVARDRDAILEAKMALDLKVEYLTGEGYNVKIPEWRAMQDKIERVEMLLHGAPFDFISKTTLRLALDAKEGES